MSKSSSQEEYLKEMNHLRRKAGIHAAYSLPSEMDFSTKEGFKRGVERLYELMNWEEGPAGVAKYDREIILMLGTPELGQGTPCYTVIGSLETGRLKAKHIEDMNKFAPSGFSFSAPLDSGKLLRATLNEYFSLIAQIRWRDCEYLVKALKRVPAPDLTLRAYLKSR